MGAFRPQRLCLSCRSPRTPTRSGESVGQATTSFGDTHAVHFPSSYEERAGRHGHRVHAYRLADRRRRHHRHDHRRRQGHERAEQRRQRDELIAGPFSANREDGRPATAAHFRSDRATATNFTNVTSRTLSASVQALLCNGFSRSLEMLSLIRRLKSDKRAATAIEYSLIVFLIATATVAAMGNVGQKVMNMLGPAANALN